MKKNYIKIAFDLLMALTFALLMNPRVLSRLPFHEIAGLVFGVAILTHIGLNFQWVKNTTLKIFKSNLPKKTRFSYLLNILLLVCMSTVVITGILISRVVFPNLAVEGNRMVRGLHTLSSYGTLALVGIHIGVHWQWIMSICKKLFKSKEGGLRKGTTAAALFALVILAGGIQWYSSTASINSFAFGPNSIQQRSFDRDFNRENIGRGQGTQQFSDDEKAFRSGRTQNGDFFERRGGGEFGRRGHRGNANVFLGILPYFVTWAVLIVAAYYWEKRIAGKKTV